jgi:CBS domain-containing protein
MTVQGTEKPTLIDETLVEEAMHRGVVSCPYETPLSMVAQTMATSRVHCVVGLGDITEDDTQLWGVVSDRDVVAAAAAGEEARATAGGSAATEVLTIGPRETLRRAAQVMSEHDLSHLIVVEPDSDRPLGVLSTLDIAAVVGGAERRPSRYGGSRVDELMTTPVVTVRPETPLKTAAALLVERGISGVPVVRGDEVVGVLSEADIVAVERGPATDGRSALARLLAGDGVELAHAVAARTAGEAMSSPAVMIAWWQPASAAATLMTDKGVKRLPVVRDGKLVGILSRRDLVRAFARPDTEIRRDIRDSVIVGSLWLVPTDVSVEVRGGEVTLTGAVDRALDAELLVRQVERVPGVVSVSSSVSAREENSEPRRFRQGRG